VLFFFASEKMTYKEARNSTPMERFMDKVQVQETNGCWIWMGGRTLRKGKRGSSYGVFHCDGRNHPAHRWHWEQKHGPLRPGLELLHSCENPICVNLDHLSPGTRSQNQQMGRPPVGRSGYRGVYPEKGRKKPWRAQIMKDKKRWFLAYTSTTKEGAVYYNLAAMVVFDKRKLNLVSPIWVLVGFKQGCIVSQEEKDDLCAKAAELKRRVRGRGFREKWNALQETIRNL
jgi:HNH endonuclease